MSPGRRAFILIHWLLRFLVHYLVNLTLVYLVAMLVSELDHRVIDEEILVGILVV